MIFFFTEEGTCICSCFDKILISPGIVYYELLTEKESHELNTPPEGNFTCQYEWMSEFLHHAIMGQTDQCVKIEPCLKSLATHPLISYLQVLGLVLHCLLGVSVYAAHAVTVKSVLGWHVGSEFLHVVTLLHALLLHAEYLYLPVVQKSV